VLVHTLVPYLIMRLGISVGGFVPQTYVRQVVENSDFRKYDDGLRMILDCTPEREDGKPRESRLAQPAFSPPRKDPARPMRQWRPQSFAKSRTSGATGRHHDVWPSYSLHVVFLATD
jgi:hypothetical protein